VLDGRGRLRVPKGRAKERGRHVDDINQIFLVQKPMDIPTPKRTKMLVFHKNIHIYSRYHSELLVEKCNPVHSDTIEPRRIIVMKEMVKFAPNGRNTINTSHPPFPHVVCQFCT
jgi:hypothetical protein